MEYDSQPFQPPDYAGSKGDNLRPLAIGPTSMKARAVSDSSSLKLNRRE